jgi:dihydroorotase
MLLSNCKIVGPGGVTKGDILIEGGKIKEIGKDMRADETIDVKGKLVMPGIVDVHVHMRDFKESKKEDFYSGSRAALAGGVTTYIDMPNSKPPVIDAKTFKMRCEEAGRKSVADFGINFGITPDNLGELAKVEPAACKIYMDGALGKIDDETIENAVKKCKTSVFHAEDAGTIDRNNGYIKDGDFLAHGQIREPRAEELAVKKAAEIAGRLEKRVHICHISSRKGLAMLNNFTSSEVTPHHLLLTETDLKEKKGTAKTNPPLRSHRDLKTLWEALRAGRIQIIASDHAPHTEQEKEAGALTAPSGIPNLDVMSKLFLTLVNKGTITLPALAKLMCTNPARIFNIEQKGEIAPGKDADILILDIEKTGKIDPSEFYSKAKYSPFEGWKTKGTVDTVILRGQVAFEDNDFNIKKGHGKMIGGKA